MTQTDAPPARHPADQFGRQVALRLAAGADELPHEIRERLRAARVRALQRRKAAPAPAGVGGAARLSRAERSRLLYRIGTILPLIVLAAGLVLIHQVQTEERATELAEVDAALLTDDLPPAAYADPGFVQFLKSGRSE